MSQEEVFIKKKNKYCIVRTEVKNIGNAKAMHTQFHILFMQ